MSKGTTLLLLVKRQITTTRTKTKSPRKRRRPKRKRSTRRKRRKSTRTNTSTRSTKSTSPVNDTAETAGTQSPVLKPQFAAQALGKLALQLHDSKTAAAQPTAAHRSIAHAATAPAAPIVATALHHATAGTTLQTGSAATAPAPLPNTAAHPHRPRTASPERTKAHRHQSAPTCQRVEASGTDTTIATKTTAPATTGAPTPKKGDAERFRL